jgi:hypothetical protein
MRQWVKYLASRYIPTRLYLPLVYRWRFGRWGNLKRPATLNEKLHWKKMHGYEPFHTMVADKYAVREWVAARVGERYLIPLVAVSDDAERLDLAGLPEPCIIKTTHASGQNVIIQDKRRVEEESLKTQFRRWMSQNEYYLSREPQYRDIKPRLIVEELLTDADGKIPMDFKFHCFHGTVGLIQVDIDRFTDHRRNLYDVNWQLLPFTWCLWKKNRPLWPNGRAVARPGNLEEMIAVAQTLSKEFDYLRVDLYNCDGKIYFGELTLHHGGGWERFDPPFYDAFYGEKLHLRGGR